MLPEDAIDTAALNVEIARYSTEPVETFTVLPDGEDTEPEPPEVPTDTVPE